MGIIIRQSIKGTIINYIGVFIGFFVTFFVMAKFLTAEEIGLTNVMLNTAILFAGFASLGTNSSTFRFYSYFKDKENKDNGFFGFSLIVPIAGFLIVLLLYHVFQIQVKNYFSANSGLFVKYYNYVIPLAFFFLYITVFETNSNVLMRIVIPKAIREIYIRLGLLTVYLLYAFAFLSLTGFVIGLCAVYGIAMLLNFIYFVSLNKTSYIPNFAFISKPLRNDILKYSAFTILVVFTSALTPMLNTFFVSAKLGLTANGILAIAVYIATIIEIPYRSLGAITQPQLAEAIKNNDTCRANFLCKSVSLHQLLAGSIIFLLIIINIDLLFQLLPNGHVYSSGKYVVIILGLSKLVNSILLVGTTVLSYSKYYFLVLVFSPGLTLLAIVLNLTLIPIWGINGAALATLFAFLVYLLTVIPVIYVKTKINPFSFSQLKVILLFAGLFIVNYLWTITIHPLILASINNVIYASILDRGTCTIFLLLIAFCSVYYLNISKEINYLFDKLFSYIRKFKS